MVELTEYTLVVLVSALFAAASVSTYETFSKFETVAEVEGSFSTITSLVTQASQDGSSSGTLALPQSTLACSDGMLSLRASGEAVNRTYPFACSFDLEIPGGLETVSFDCNSSTLSARVS